MPQVYSRTAPSRPAIVVLVSATRLYGFGQLVDRVFKPFSAMPRNLGIAEKILPILTPEQRKIAADKIRDMANKGGELPFAH